MTVSLEGVVPWGRSFAEYTRMFHLTPADLQQRILGCSDGPASFNAEATAHGLHVTSCDPIYTFTAAQINQRIEETYPVMLDQVKLHQHTFVWDAIPSPEHLGQIRMDAMRRFLADFSLGNAEGRYVAAALPHLPFANRQFDLALSGHFLFLYADYFSLDFHIHAIKELCRVAPSVRIFPLLGLDGEISPHLAPTITHLNQHGYTTHLTRVDYEFQVGGHTMLQIHAPLHNTN